MSLLRDVTYLPTSRLSRIAALLLVVAAGPAPAGDPSGPPATESTAATAAGVGDSPQPPPVDASPAAPATRGDAYAAFRAAFDAGDYASAVEHGRTVLEFTEREPARRTDDLQVALLNLAVAEQRAGDLVPAEASYLRAIELIESTGRRTSARLARAWAGLASTYHAGQRHELAANAFDRAIALNRRSEGLFNEEQLPLLEKQADSLTELGRLEDALLAHRYALQVVERRHGERSLPYAAELESIGRWYTRVRAFEAGRATLRKSALLVESASGKTSTSLVGPLTGLAENARRWLLDPQIRAMSGDDERRSIFHDTILPTPPGLTSNTIAVEGLKALERAAEIVDADRDASPALVAAVHSQLGDWHQARQLPEEARPHYLRAWQAAGQAPDGAALQQSLFGAPVLIRYSLPDGWDRYARRPPEEVERREVALELTVTADGEVRDPRPVGESLDEKLLSQTLRAVESARYRPRVVDGETVETTGVRFIQPFYLLRESPPQEPAVPAQVRG